VPGHHGCRTPARLLPDAPHGDTGGEHRRLGVLGAIQILFRSLAHQRPEIAPERVGGFLEGLFDGWMRLSERVEHADRLRTLTGKEDSELLAHGTWRNIQLKSDRINGISQDQQDC
jgi:hypothetical protein